jgi:uncharacterized membrane protein
MTGKTFKFATVLLTIALAIVVSVSIFSGNLYIPVIAVIVALIVRYILQRSTREVMRDERTRHVNERAAALTVQICVPLAAVVAVALLALRKNISPELFMAGNTLAYFSCFVLLVHSALYSYLNRRS